MTTNPPPTPVPASALLDELDHPGDSPLDRGLEFDVSTRLLGHDVLDERQPLVDRFLGDWFLVDANERGPRRDRRSLPR